MNVLVIVAVVVAIAVVVALAATNPMLRRREDEAIAAVKQQLGTPLELIEPRTTAMGTDPEEAGGVRGMACLGLSDAELMAVTWSGGKTWRIPRASVTAVDTSADDPMATPKSTVTVTYARPEGGEATAMFRLRDAQDWLDALGYDDGSGGADEVEPAGSDETATGDEGGGSGEGSSRGDAEA